MNNLLFDFISENVLLVHSKNLYNTKLDINIQNKIYVLADILQNYEIIQEVVIGANNITIFLQEDFDLKFITNLINNTWNNNKVYSFKSKHIKIPVIYGGELGPDLEYVADFHKITVEEVVKIHTQSKYSVFFIGFQAGFPYLGGLNEKIYTPRKKIPRLEVPKGSVGIGGSQTGIYPLKSSGGWQIIGNCNLDLFDPHKNPPILLSPNDIIEFYALDIKK